MKHSKFLRWFAIGLILAPTVVFAQDSGTGGKADTKLYELMYAFDNITLMICAILVIFMQAGFAMLTAGLNSAKNTVNILFKNFMDFCIAALFFGLIGFSLMYPGSGAEGKWFGFAGFGISMKSPTVAEIAKSYAGGSTLFHPNVDFLFQVAFAGAAATIVAGSVAGRLKFSGYLIYSAVLTALIYPISGMWKWGGGALNAAGFQDFAGSIVVHAVGGFAGLAGAIVLGPRIGKFSPDGKPRAMPGSNLALATLGTFILFVGWFGFNPGSQLAFFNGANASATVIIATNTTFAAAAGGVSAMILTWIFFRKPELSMSLNGMLAGLVGITANCDRVTNGEAVIIGVVAGGLVIAGVKLLDMLKIDDPVGAWPVHGLCGLWGGLATGIFGDIPEKMTRGSFLWVQTYSSLTIIAWAFVMMLGVFFILKVVGLLRVSRDQELRGLDIGEHGEEAYAGFQIYTVD